MIDLFTIIAATDPNAASGGIVEKFGIHLGHIVMQVISFRFSLHTLSVRFQTSLRDNG